MTCKKLSKYYYQEIQGDEDGIVLGSLTKDGDNLEARISLAYGANLCQFSLNKKMIIDYEPKLLKSSDFTGTPILYPTPNRVENGVFEFNGNIYDQVKRGRRIFEHGLVYDEPWKIVQINANKNQASLIAKIDWNKDCALYKAFPFIHDLTIVYELDCEGITITYKIHNKDSESIPFGFGLHPYFQKLSGDADTKIRVPVTHIMEATEELLPTGNLVPIQETELCLNEINPIGEYDLDHVFLRSVKDGPAIIQYLQQGFMVEITSTDDFSYFVIYSPKDEPYFCIEEQTCSTNAHNLYNQGFKEISGIKFVTCGEVRKGKVRYSISPLIH